MPLPLAHLCVPQKGSSDAGVLDLGIPANFLPDSPALLTADFYNYGDF